MAVGFQAKTVGIRSAALGAFATANADDSIALGSSSVADRALTVSVGSVNTQRQIANMAAGTADTDAVNLSQLKGVVAGLGSGATVNADGSITAPSYTVTNVDGSSTTLNNVGDAISNLDGRTTSNTTNIATNTTSINNLTEITNNLANGTVGLVQQSAAGANLTVGAATDGTAVDFTGTDGERKLTGVAAGTVSASSLDAINGAQLHGVSSSVADALGGGSAVNTDGSISAPSYTIGGTDYDNVGGAFDAVNNNLDDLNQAVSSGGVGVVQRTANANETVLTASGATASNPGAAQKLSNLAAGALSSDSTEAVNGSHCMRPTRTSPAWATE